MNEYFKGRGRSFKYAWNGIWILFGEGANARIHLSVALLVVAAGLFFDISASEWCAILICIGGVFLAEGLNTAVEKICDKVCPENNFLIGQAKDLAAGAVLLFVFMTVIVGIIIFLPKILEIFSRN